MRVCVCARALGRAVLCACCGAVVVCVIVVCVCAGVFVCECVYVTKMVVLHSVKLAAYAYAVQSP